ncbi:MAG TPA: hypothetical protein VM098_02065 [Phycisphaerae bacterium]|nr:hypothetical protein [Phycisphaerae bacterium]
MRYFRIGAMLGLVLTALGTAGCPQCPTTCVSIDQLLREYNDNAEAVPRLWARTRIAVTLVDEGRTFTWGSTSPLASPNGLLLLFKGDDRLGPHDFVLVGRELAGLELFRVGASTAQGKYYFWYRLGDKSCAWWGRHALAGAPDVKGLPVDPNQLLAVLGVCEIPDDLTALPGIALTMSTKPCAYVLTYFDRQAVTGRIGFRREVFFNWDDTNLRRPFMINFFAPDGRRVMIARLSDYRPIEVEKDSRRKPAPVMPTNIEIETIAWPGWKDDNPVRRVHVVLSDMTTMKKGQPEACQFNPPAGRVIQVDRDVELPAGPGQGRGPSK